jgi:GGDEF domain-containing protein
LSGWQGENGLVARLDSVHFLVAATNLAAGDVDALVEQIGERCRNPLFTAGIALRTSAVLGAAVAPLHGNTAVELLRCAEAAVETATQRKLAHAFFERSSDEEQRRRLRLGRRTATGCFVRAALPAVPAQGPPGRPPCFGT